MASQPQIPPPGFDALTVEEQLDYVEALWEHIAAQPDRVPIPDWHREVVRDRIAADSSKRPWAEVRRDIEAKLGLKRE